MHRHASLTLFSRQNLQTFDTSHAYLPLTIAKLSSIKNGPVFFGPPCIAALAKTSRLLGATSAYCTYLGGHW